MIIILKQSLNGIKSIILKNIFFLIMLCLLSCSKNVESVTPEIKNITESVYASGVIKSLSQYQVTSQVAGRITEIYVRSGSTVKKGEPLFEIDNEAAKLNTDLARILAENASYNSNLNKLKDLKLNIEQLELRLQNDSVLWARQSSLWSQNIGTKTEMEQRELAFVNSKKNVQSARLQLIELERQLKFAAAQSNKNLQMSKTLEREYVIKSEIDGMVFSVLKEKGEWVSNQTILAIAGSHTEFRVELLVDEYDIVRIKTGQEVIFSMDSYKNKTFNGKITDIDPIMDERTRSFTVYAAFDQLPEVVYPNLSVEANIIINTKENVLTIPRMYLLQDSFVMLKDKSLHRVKPGLRDYKIVEISEGLDQNTVIIKPD